MRFSLPFKGRAPRPSRSYAVLAKKRREGAQKARAIANSLISDGNVVKLWKNGKTEEIRAICKEEERKYGDSSFVSETMIWITLRNVLRGLDGSS